MELFANMLSRTLSRINQLPVLGFSQNLTQARNMSRMKIRRTHPRSIWPLKKRERNDQELTADNQEFINKVVFDQYGPPAVRESTGMPYVSPLKEIIKPRGEWQEGSIRTGLLARKIGVYPMWNKRGQQLLTTLLQVVDNHVVKYITPEECRRNYGTRFGSLGVLIVGAESTDPQRFTKEYCGLFRESGIMPKVKLGRFQVTPEAALPPGTPLYATHFQVGQRVDIVGKTIDRGFQGVMKRWGFHGNRATHGCTKSHRRGGNTGGGGEKGRVWPGTKLPGHMGCKQVVQRAYKVVRINTKYNVIYVQGPNIPGETNNFVSIRDSRIPTYGRPTMCPFPTHYPDEASEPLPEDIFDPSLHTYEDPTITFE